MARVARHMLDLRQTLSLEHVCASCGHRQHATVRAVGQGAQFGGTAAGPTAHQREQLEREAIAGLMPDARESLGLVPCPKCGRRGTRALVSYVLRALVLSVLFGALVASLGVLALDLLGVFGSQYGSGYGDTMFTVAGALAAVGTLGTEIALVVSRLRRAREAVQFDAPA